MEQYFEAENFDENGKPNGGYATATGIDIRWQQGPIVVGGVEQEPNGAFVETLMKILIQRMEYYQTTEFKCRENALVITKLEEALHWQQHRINSRAARGVLGTHKV